MSGQRAMLLGVLVLGSVGLWSSAAVAAEPGMKRAPAQWETLGLSGGGAMFTPAISPCDPNLMMVNCDMSAAYISADGGATWRMIHYSQLHSSTRCRPAFHPTDPRTIFAASGWEGLRVSHDRGEHWAAIGNLPHGLEGEIAIDPGQPALMLAGAGGGVWLSGDGGQRWQRCAGPRGQVVGFHFDQTSRTERRVCFAATTEGVWRSDDGGATWAEKSAGLPWRELRSFCGGSNARDKLVMLYCAVPGKAEVGRYAGGLYRSADRGESWVSAMGAGLNVETTAFDRWAMNPVAQYHRVLTTNVRPLAVWGFNANTGIPPPHQTAAYRSDDGGKNWRATFYPDPRYKPCNVQEDFMTAVDGQFYQDVPTGVASDAANPDHVLQVDGGRCYITTNGGKDWTCGSTRQAAPEAANTAKNGPAWVCNGLVVTTTWHYYLDPFQPRRHYICYTDIGFARSLDAARTWMWWSRDGRPPWQNTCYELAFDPQTPGKIWGAFSNVHDIPNDNIISGRHRSTGPGGICLSTDFGATWKVSSAGLPLAPAVSVVVDPRSPAGGRTLYASLFGQGVFKSADDGRNWTKTSEGLGSSANLRACRLCLHKDGTLLVLITALRQGKTFLADGVGLYRSKDGAKSWQAIGGATPLLWPKDFTVDPADSRVIYLGAADAGGKEQGGLYRTTDGGATWARLVRKGPEHFGAYLPPKRPGWIYMTLTEGAPGAGLWLSKDGGATWSALGGLPFVNAQRVCFDPADESVIYVTTFGGSVWRGPAAE